MLTVFTHFIWYLMLNVMQLKMLTICIARAEHNGKGKSHYCYLTYFTYVKTKQACLLAIYEDGTN